MVTLIAKLKVRPGTEAEFESAMEKMIAHVRANEPGTLTYVLYRDRAVPSQFVVYEVYTDDAALAAHSSSEAMLAFFGAVGGMLDGRPEMSMYDEIGGKN